MTLWLDAQLPPALARWIGEQPWGVDAVPVREMGLRDASDPEIFRRARAGAAVVMTKDRDFIRLLDEQGSPPQVIWLRLRPSPIGSIACCSTSSASSRHGLAQGQCARETFRFGIQQPTLQHYHFIR